MINTNNDLKFGMLLTTQNGGIYAVAPDENGDHAAFRMNGEGAGNYSRIEVGNGKLAIAGGLKGSRDVVKVQDFDCAPGFNRFSECLKICAASLDPRRQRAFIAPLVTIWTAVDKEKEAAAKRIKDREDALLADKKAYAAKYNANPARWF